MDEANYMRPKGAIQSKADITALRPCELHYINDIKRIKTLIDVFDMYYVYVLKSKKDNEYYVGRTRNIKKRFDEHNAGLSKATMNRRPFVLIYFEGSIKMKDAIHREKYLKTSWGKKYIKTRVKNYLIG